MDLRFALRSMGKNPGFTILAVVVMGLGIGANTAVFSVVNSVLLKPLDYREPDRIVTIRTYWKTNGKGNQVSAPDFHDWHDQSSAFAAMAYYYGGETDIRSGSTAEYAEVAGVTPEFAAVFGVTPELGRTFSAEETKPGSAGAALISDCFWRSRLGGDPGVLGRTVRVDGFTIPIVGVLPARFHFPNKTDIWFPANTFIPETASRSAHNYRVVARLKPGVTVAEAQSQLTAIAARIEQQSPKTNKDKSAFIAPMRDTLVKDVRATLYILFGAVALVLLIACANVANLLLAKATGRAREMAIRAAVGASRARIVRLLVTESLALAVVSGAVGVVFALWGSNALVALAPPDVPRLAETTVDGAVLAFTIAASLVSSVLFGLAPALHASRVDLNEALKQGNRVTGGGAGQMRSVLVVAEIALSVVLLAGAGLLMKSFVALQAVQLGFRPERVLVMPTSAPSSNPEEMRRAIEFYRQLLAGARSMPGVIAAGATRMPPGDTASDGSYFVDHAPQTTAVVNAPQAVFNIAEPGMLAALGIPLRRGRDLSDRDTPDAPFVALINEALAKKAFPGQDPIGHEIYCGYDSPKPMRIVGVIGDVRQRGPALEALPEIVMPFEQHTWGGAALQVLVRTASDPGGMAEALRQKAHELSPDVPVKFTNMEQLMSENIAAPRFRTLLFGIFAAVALCLAIAGVYGVMAYAVGQRANEIGLRMAMGAGPGDVLRLVLRQALGLAAAGVAIGLAASAAATRLLEKLLFGVRPFDLGTYAAVAGVLAVVALVATWLPARRAMRVDPVVALRQE